MASARIWFSERESNVGEFDLQGESSGRCSFELLDDELVRCGQVCRIELPDSRVLRARIDGVMFFQNAVHCTASWEPYSDLVAPQRPVSQTPSITTAERWSSPVVVVVEDDEDVRAVLCDVLEQAGIRVLSAENGRAALDLLKTSEALPSLILLDLMMPDMDGWSFRETQKADERLMKVPVVAISAARLGDSTIDVQLLEKPFDLDRLLKAVREYCFALPV